MNDIIIGGGEVGHALYHLFDKSYAVIDSDVSRNIIPIGMDNSDIGHMHICFPFSPQFATHIFKWCNNYHPRVIIIHSTVPVGTTYKVQTIVGARTPVIYSPIRGVHSRFVADMRTYTKVWASVEKIKDETVLGFERIWEHVGIRTDRWDSVKDLELGKVLTDTTYYGWLIAYRFAADTIARNYGVDSEKIWDFAEEIHEELGNRPRMFSNIDGIGGHCVLPNLHLNSDPMSSFIEETINKINFQHRRNRDD